MRRDIRPRFQVRKLEGEVEHEVMSYEEQKDQNGKKRPVLVRKMVKEPAGYMVYLPKGDSIHIRNDEELRRLGFDQAPELQDMESGAVIPTPEVMDLEKVNASATLRSSRSSRGSATSAVQAGGNE